MLMEKGEIRLDPETRSKHEEAARAARLAAAERIGRMEVEDVPKPAELKRQLSEVIEWDRTL